MRAIDTIYSKMIHLNLIITVLLVLLSIMIKSNAPVNLFSANSRSTY